MSRQFPHLRGAMSWALIVLLGLCGCHPQQPLYLFEDRDLSHYLDVATEIEYPDVEVESLGDVDGAVRPFSLDNSDPQETWELTLEEAVQHALANSKVMRSLGAQSLPGRQNLTMPDFLVRNPAAAQTVYDPALTESNPRFGVEAALSAFDAQFVAGVQPNDLRGGETGIGWAKTDQPQNFSAAVSPLFPQVLQEDVGTFTAQLSKTAATGGTFTFVHDLLYTDNNRPTRTYPADWTVMLKGKFRQPLLQRAGVQYNRIAGPGAIPGFNNGVMIARLNTDVSLADFEGSVRDLVYDVEVAYWDLYLSYRSLDAVVAGRDSGLQTWRQEKVKHDVGTGKGAHAEAQARNQYFLFRRAVEESLNNLYKAESNLRYIMGLAATDGRLIRPADEPTSAKVVFDWCDAHAEAMCRVVELRKQRWQVKRRELEMITAKNYLLPRLDLTAMYQWQGLGNTLVESSGGTGDHTVPGSNAYQSMLDGNFQNWGLGLELSMPLGFRKEMAGVRHAQLNLARERAVLQEMELESSHQLAWAVREAEANLVLSQTNFNRRIAAQAEVDAAEAKYVAGVLEGTLDQVLDAQRRLAEAERDYYSTLVEYNKSIAQVHFRKGSLLEYNGVYLAEGPWPGKAYFDARRRARARDASFYLNYGFTRPKVASRGTYEQHAGHVGSGPVLFDGEFESDEIGPEMIPTPAPRSEQGLLESLPPEPTVQHTEELDGGPLLEAIGSQIGRSREGGGSRVVLKASAEEPVDKDTADEDTTTKRRWTAVKDTAFRKPQDADSGDDSKLSEPKHVEDKWVRSKSSSNRHESEATPSAAGSDRSASDPNGIQR